MCLGRVPTSRRACSLLLPPSGGGSGSANGVAKGTSLLDKIRAESCSKNFVEQEEEVEHQFADHPHKPRYSMQSTASDITTDADDIEILACKRRSRSTSLSTAEDSSVASSSISEEGRLKSILKSESTSKSSTCKTKKTVQFGHVHIRSFNVRMGDTTNCLCVNYGPPLILSNSYVDRPPRRVSSFDAHCGSAEPLTVEERRTILIERFGYTLREIMEGELAIRVAKIHEAKHSHKRMIPRVNLVKGIKKKLLSARAG